MLNSLRDTQVGKPDKGILSNDQTLGNEITYEIYWQKVVFFP